MLLDETSFYLVVGLGLGCDDVFSTLLKVALSFFGRIGAFIAQFQKGAA